MDKPRLTAKEAAERGYKVSMASAGEVGLMKGDLGLRTWWIGAFDSKLPPLDHPAVADAIANHESILERFPKFDGLHPPKKRMKIGGMLRCCIETLQSSLVHEVPGETVQCKYHPTPNHQWIFDGDVWKWDHPSEK